MQPCDPRAKRPSILSFGPCTQGRFLAPWLGLALTLSLACEDKSNATDDAPEASASEPGPGESSAPVQSSTTPVPTGPASTGPEPTASTPTATTSAPPSASSTPPTASTGGGGDDVTTDDSGAGGSDAGPANSVPQTTDDQGPDGGVEAGIDPCAIADFVAPSALSETGLYADIAAGTLAPGVREYRPRFELWSDGADKRRFVYLPPCSKIDNTDPDFWIYPVGTKLWKEFSRDNEAGESVRVETRIFEKRTATKWFWTAFIWNDDQTDATIAEGDGATTLIAAENAKGTPHDVPGQKTCESCHYNMEDQVLGFSGLQLDFDAEEGFVDLGTLAREGLLTGPAAVYTLPGTAEQQAALGYMHANCGACHNPNSKEADLELEFWLQLSGLGSMETTSPYLSTVGQMSLAEQPPEDQPLVRVVPGDLDNSAVYWRMTQPVVFPTNPKGGIHMPLIATEVTDEAGVQLVADWINSLPPQ